MSNPQRKKVKVVSINRLKEGDLIELSDFQISASDTRGDIAMVDFEIISDSPKVMHEYEIRPGFWRITPEDGMQKLELPEETYFETETSKKLLGFMNNFRNKLHVYDKYRRRKKRAILLGSAPGIGKSSLINYFLRNLKEESKICALKIDNSKVSWELMTQMFMKANSGSAEFIVLVIEDIGGTELDERHNSVQSDLLNFLEGNSDVFKIPTLVVGTTNFLNELGNTLIDRPGRFDRVEQVDPPKDEEVIVIVEGYIGRQMTDEEKKALLGKAFTPPYCIEAIIRSEIDELSITEAVDQLVKQREKSQKRQHGVKGGSLGFGGAIDGFDD